MESVRSGLANFGVWGIFVAIVLHGLPLPAQLPVVVIGFSVGLILVIEEPRSLPRLPYLLLAIFLSASLLSILGADSVSRSLYTSLSLFPQLLLFHGVVSRFNEVRIIRLLWTIIFTGTIIAIIFLTIALTHPEQNQRQWMALAGVPFFSVPNDLLFLVLILPFVLDRFMARIPIVLRGGLAVVTLIFFAVLIVYRIRTGVLLFSVLGVFLVLTMAKNRWRTLAWLLPLVLLFLLGMDAISGFALLQKFAKVQTLSHRIPLWMAAWEMFLTDPWLGHGPGAFSLLYRSYLNNLSFPDWVVVSSVITQHVPWSHNLYLELLAERGLLGLASFLGLTMIAGRVLSICYRNPRWSSLAFSMAIILGLIMIGGLSEFSLLRYWFSQLFILVLAMIFVLGKLEET